MNRTLNGLETAGLVARHPADDDARRVRVTLTPAGLALIAETRALRSAWFSAAARRTSPPTTAAPSRPRLPALRRLAQS